MFDVRKFLLDVFEDERVYEDNIDLFESGLLDSFAFIELFSKLEDYGIELHPTRINIEDLRTPKLIEKLIENYINENNK